MSSQSEFDYIIVGAGSAGCVLANRLGMDRAARILVLEAGPMDRDLMIHVPAGVHAVWHKPSLNWSYQTEADDGLGGREISMPRGKVLGGSSSINSMVYMRGHPRDYDSWGTRKGLQAWGFDQCLAYFRAGETSDRGASQWRGDAGPLGVSRAGYDNPLYDAFVEAGAQAGQGYTDDPSGAQPEGTARLDATRRYGRRCSAAVAHMRPALARGNVTLITSAHVERIEMSGTRATGIVYRHKGALRVAKAAKEVILSGGALNSPHLLMLSGIGPAGMLAASGVTCQHHVPGVGQNLQDHACLILQFACPVEFPIHRIDNPLRKGLAGARWVFFRDGVAASNIWEAGGLVRSSDAAEYPDLQYHFAPVGFEYSDHKIALSQAFAIHIDLLRPRSRGVVSLKSADPRAAPLMRFNYYDDPRDLDDMINGVEKARELVAQSAFEGLRGAEIMPGADVKTREDIARWIRSASETDFHPCGTCRMGDDADCVVDGELRVHGIEGLRVVDASVLPRIVSGNLNAPVQMLAARAADMIAGRAQLPPERAEFAEGVR